MPIKQGNTYSMGPPYITTLPKTAPPPQSSPRSAASVRFDWLAFEGIGVGNRPNGYKTVPFRCIEIVIAFAYNDPLGFFLLSVVADCSCYEIWR